MATRFVASMLLDGADDRPYLAALLARSLIRFGGVAAADVGVYAPAALDRSITEPVRALGCTIERVADGSDGPAGNELLRQLQAWCEADQGAGGAWLFALGAAVSASLSPPAILSVAGMTPDGEPAGLLYVPREFAAARLAGDRSDQRCFPCAASCSARVGLPYMS